MKYDSFLAFTGIQVIPNQGMIYEAWVPEDKKRRRRSLSNILLTRARSLTSKKHFDVK